MPPKKSKTTTSTSAPPTPTVYLITGSNRGLGLTFAQHLSTSPSNIVLATVRSLKNTSSYSALSTIKSHSRALHILECDTGSPASIAALPAVIAPILKKEGVSKVDFVLNNAGINSVPDAGVLDIPEKEFERTLSVNVLGPAKIVEGLVKAGLLGGDPKSPSKPVIKAAKNGNGKRTRTSQGDEEEESEEKPKGVVLNMTSGLGSISNAVGAPRSKSTVYSISKAAVNMLSVHQARQLEERGIVVVCVDPGWVKTDMGGAGAILEPDESIGGMIKLLHGLTRKDSAKYLRYDGTELKW